MCGVAVSVLLRTPVNWFGCAADWCLSVVIAVVVMIVGLVVWLKATCVCAVKVSRMGFGVSVSMLMLRGCSLIVSVLVSDRMQVPSVVQPVVCGMFRKVMTESRNMTLLCLCVVSCGVSVRESLSVVRVPMRSRLTLLLVLALRKGLVALQLVVRISRLMLSLLTCVCSVFCLVGALRLVGSIL